MHDVFPDVEPHLRVEQVRLSMSCVTCGLGCGCGLRRWDGPGLDHLDVHIEDVVELVVLNCIDPCPVWFDRLWSRCNMKCCCGPGACISVVTWLELSEQ